MHINRLAEMDEAVAGTAQFTALYIGVQLLMTQIDLISVILNT